MDYYKNMEQYKEAFLKEYKDPIEDIPGKPLTMEEKKKILDELCEGIGSVATGRDNLPRLRKKRPIRCIDETWEGG